MPLPSRSLASREPPGREVLSPALRVRPAPTSQTWARPCVLTARWVNFLPQPTLPYARRVTLELITTTQHKQSASSVQRVLLTIRCAAMTFRTALPAPPANIMTRTANPPAFSVSRAPLVVRLGTTAAPIARPARRANITLTREKRPAMSVRLGHLIRITERTRRRAVCFASPGSITA